MQGAVQRDVCSGKVVAHNVCLGRKLHIEFLATHESAPQAHDHRYERTFKVSGFTAWPTTTFSIHSVTSAWSFSDLPWCASPTLLTSSLSGLCSLAIEDAADILLHARENDEDDGESTVRRENWGDPTSNRLRKVMVTL